MSWWLNLIYLLCVGEMSLAHLALMSVISFATYPISQAFILIRELLLAIIRITLNKIDKL